MCISAEDITRANEILYRESKQVTQEEYDFMKSQLFPVEQMSLTIVG